MSPNARDDIRTPVDPIPLPWDDTTDVPPETTDADPESQTTPAVPPSVAGDDLGAVPAPIRYQLDQVQGQLREAQSDVTAALAAIVGIIRGDISAATGSAVGVVHTVAGDVQRRVDDVHRAADGAATRMLRGVRERLDRAGAELRGEGIEVPLDPAEWLMLIATPEPEWLPYVVPAIGIATGVIDPGGDMIDCTRTPDDPACQVPQSPPYPPPGGEPVTPFKLCPDGVTMVGIDQPCPPYTQTPIVPIPPPSPPSPPWPGYPPPPPEPGACCPTTPDVTVNVPAPVVNVNVPPWLQGGPYQPWVGPDCPDPPPVDITNIVNVPGDGTKQVPGGETLGKLPGDPQKARLDWSQSKPCHDLDEIIKGIAPQHTGTPGAPMLWEEGGFMAALEGLGEGAMMAVSIPFSLVTEGLTGLMNAITSASSVVFRVGAQAAGGTLRNLAGDSVKNPAAAAHFAAKLAAANFAEKHTGMPLSYLMTAETYAYQYSNPQYIPSQAQADTMYLTGKIDDWEWQCFTMAHGNIPTHARKYRDAIVGRPTFEQLVQLRMRDEITEEDFKAKAVEIGWRNETWVSETRKLAWQIPPMTDLVRFMVRDAGDDEIVRKYDYDKDLDKKLTPDIVEWAKAQGLTKKYMQYMWRSHWEIPSNTQLYEMFHRLRPDRPEVLEWDTAAAGLPVDTAPQLLGPRPPVVTLADVKEALEVNDKAPAWIDRLLAVSYATITRTDAIRAYQIGAFNREQLYNAFLDNGYSPRGAETLVTFHTQAQVRTEANATGVLTIRKIVRLFKDGALSRTLAFDALKPIMEDPQRRNALLDRAETEIRADLRALQLKGLKRHFLAGEDRPGGWLAALTAITEDAASARRILDQWNALYIGRLREPTAAKLCTWFKDGLISAQDFWNRVFNLGYSATDAEHLVASCNKSRLEALQKVIAQAAKEKERKDKEALKERQKQLERQCHPPKPCWDGSPAP